MIYSGVCRYEQVGVHTANFHPIRIYYVAGARGSHKIWDHLSHRLNLKEVIGDVIDDNGVARQG